MTIETQKYNIFGKYFSDKEKSHIFALVIFKKSKVMATAIIKIPFQEDLLYQIDRFVERKIVRSREELILAATEMYIQRKRDWQNLFSYGEQLASENNLSEDDVMNEIKAYRNNQ